MITVFTPTYNRGYILPKLYESLKNQSCFEFEWIIIDDCSTDETSELCDKWLSEDKCFEMQVIRLEKQGGKQRAINTAVQLAHYEFFFIVDSDDYLMRDAIQKISAWCNEIRDDSTFVGVSGIKCKKDGDYIRKPNFAGRKFLDCTNIERSRYNLDADMAEVYKTDILRQYKFPVWHDETFTPEAVVWDQLAIDGYKIRYYDEKIYVCDYLSDGLTRGGNKLYYHNLMGCAMSFNTRLKYASGVREKFCLIREILVCCFLKHNLSYIKKSHYPIIAYLMLPIGYVYYLRRKRLFVGL